MSAVYNDLAILALVIEAGGFTRASEIAGITKSLLSRRIGDLERQLGVQLIDRTSRRFAATSIGLELSRHGASIRSEGEAALNVVRESHNTPSGALRVACPVVLAELLVGPLCVEFAARYPGVVLTVDMTDGTRAATVDGYDIVLTASMTALPNSEVIARRLFVTEYELVASREWLDRNGSAVTPQDLENRDGIGWWEDNTHVPKWTLRDSENREFELHVRPGFITNNLQVARLAALRGLGMARLPVPLCAEDIAVGRLFPLLAGWHAQPVAIHAMYTSRRSLTLAGRALLAELSACLARWAATFE